MYPIHRPVFLLALALTGLAPLGAGAQESVLLQEPLLVEPAAACDCKRPWTFRVIPYVWAPGVQGDLTVGRVTAPVDVSIGKTLEIAWNDINWGLSGQIEARKGPIGVIFNGLYADVSPGQRVRNLDFSSRFRVAILDTALTYELPLPEGAPLPCGTRFEVLGGFRFNSLSAGLTVTGPRGNSATRRGTEDWFDPIVGARLRVPLGDSWTAQVRGDVGGFGIGEASRFTWNIEATLEYRLGSQCSLLAGYRWLDIDYRAGGNNREFGYNVNMGGPIVGLAFDF